MPNTIVNSRVVLSAASVVVPNALIATWYNSLTVKPTASLLIALNNLSAGLNTDGDWTLLDLFHPIGGLETDEQRLKPLISTSGLDFVAVNSPTLNTNGVTGNGTSSYLNLKWTPTTNGVQYTQNSACQLIWNRTTGTHVGAWTGSTGTAATHRLYGKYTDNNYYFKINDVVAESSGTNTNPVGLAMVKRTSSTNTLMVMNGTTLGTFSRTSTGLPDREWYLCCHDSMGTPSEFSNRNFALIGLGSGTVNQTNIYNRIQTYMTARGL